ncbi:hypothetical protein PTNB73_09511 [Pyrenophora teres f. teres]|uniref:PD-(D/E)XK nuclease-like domain-containing protein n=1 Tax=Pyrenophora teres f. teres TaxID=97479 RepID=A0A6S6WFJ8_9PLEO|nr:hypothetical protein HRS9139_10335 [Pyrenophora teres f. teres]CAA9964337.1 hypothetical protein PTMSG1_07696 [Pyrenophora teres f. maculata]KAE8835101.1 hypothetical protein PTNB85_06434 [Pyrenophora teres f. teres]KAE8843425.1 hypothetical protein HRS9122_04528 [Pyrenophora teres f. teres]KAE8856789.1 hypothetical protein PTNB73_09511 [Pyrenophora teres f. teres]
MRGVTTCQTQSINPAYLSTIPAHPLTDTGRRKTMDRKTDYVLSYSHRHPDISALYKRLAAVHKSEIGHTFDTFTKRTALFSGFEVKPASGDHTEAQLQMSIWIAASLRKKIELLQMTEVPYEPLAMIEPAFTIVGHKHSIYYAYPREDLGHGRSGIHILNQDTDLSTASIRGVFQLLKLYGNVLKYGADEKQDGYWGGFFGPVLEKLASGSMD